VETADETARVSTWSFTAQPDSSGSRAAEYLHRTRNCSRRDGPSRAATAPGSKHSNSDSTASPRSSSPIVATRRHCGPWPECAGGAEHGRAVCALRRCAGGRLRGEAHALRRHHRRDGLGALADRSPPPARRKEWHAHRCRSRASIRCRRISVPCSSCATCSARSVPARSRSTRTSGCSAIQRRHHRFGYPPARGGQIEIGRDPFCSTQPMAIRVTMSNAIAIRRACASTPHRRVDRAVRDGPINTRVSVGRPRCIRTGAMATARLPLPGVHEVRRPFAHAKAALVSALMSGFDGRCLGPPCANC